MQLPTALWAEPPLAMQEAVRDCLPGYSDPIQSATAVPYPSRAVAANEPAPKEAEEGRKGLALVA